MSDALRTRVREYYEARLRQHGPTPAGVDWNSEQSQELRFQQLARLLDPDPAASVIDYGCGYGALLPWLREHGYAGAYTGFDVSPEMVASARARAEGLRDAAFTTDRRALTPADYAVASGIFNVKMDTSDDGWGRYVLSTIADLAAVGSRGFAFNALTLYSDVERRRPDLYYADPLALFDHCKRTYSRYVTLLHDYPLYEFTLLVRT